jgi:diguanylate cyclase (GGDEF)-like protein
MLLCDIDFFKRINDVHGHPVGDEVLQEVSTRLMHAVRSHDAVGRFGGEEFLIVLSGCVGEDLRHRAEQVREAVNRSPIYTISGPITTSVSIGAITIEQWNKSMPIEPLMKLADDALYQAKSAGRNTVVCANSLLTV